MTSTTAFEIVDQIALLRLDDGKANAVTYATLAAVDAAVAEAENSAQALVIAGRDGRFSAGFDLKAIQAGPDAPRQLAGAGARTAMRIYGASVPVVAACTGHALAFGAIMLLSSDLRIGADVEAKIGLNELSIGLPLPIFAMELARDRLSPRHFTSATTLARVYSPRGAAEAGYLDEIVEADAAIDVAMQRAAEIAGYVRPRSFAQSRGTARQATIDHILSTLDEDLERFGFLDAK